MKLLFLFTMACWINEIHSVSYNCMKFDFDKGTYYDLTPLSAPLLNATDLRVTDMKFDKSGQVMPGTAYISVCGRRTQIDKCASKSHGYYIFDNDKSCMLLAVENDSPLDTIWNLDYDDKNDRLIIEGDNTNTGLGFNYEVNMICDQSFEKDAKGKYDSDLKKFIFTVSSKYACKLRISNLTMVYHEYRYFIVVICLSIGLFLNFYGVAKLRVSLLIIGFLFLFLLTFILLSSLFYETEKSFKLFFTFLIAGCMGALGAYFTSLLEEYINYLFIIFMTAATIFFFSSIVINLLLLLAIIGVVAATAFFLSQKMPKVQLAISTSWIGCMLFFMSLNLVFFSSEDLSYFLFNLREGKLNKLNFFFIVFMILSTGLFAYGVYFQLKHMKESESLDFGVKGYLDDSHKSEVYKSLSEPKEQP